jgi:hypothetical protein
MVQIPKLEPRLAVLDIETSKTIFGAYPGNKPQYLSHKDILQDWFIICAAWKWIGHKQIHTVSLLDDMKAYKQDPTDDLYVVKTLHSLLSKADAVIGHNVDKFDWGKILERIICYGLEPIQKPKMIDTLKMAKQANFSYNNLDYLCKRLETSSQKRENGGNAMWLDIVQGKNPERIEECVEYCIGDIPTAEQLYLKMAPYMPTKMLLNQNAWKEADKQGCPYCSSMNYVIDKKRKTVSGVSTSYRCSDCGHVFTDGKTIMKNKPTR